MYTMKGYNLYQKTAIAVSMTIALGLSACGGSGSSGSSDGGGDSSVKTGIFIDAPVKGLHYKTLTQEGVTTGTGEFTYKEGEQITYSIDGVNIGSATAAPEVPVTNLPNPLELAQLLQSLDIDPTPELIDISGVKFPAGIKSALASFVQSGENFESLLTGEHLVAINTESGNILDSLTPVTVEDALDHLDDYIDEDLVQSDISKQTYINLEDEFVVSFKEDGTGNDFSNNGGNDGQPSKNNYTWALAENGELTVSYGDGDDVVVNLLSTSGNQYAMLAVDGDGTNITNFYKAQSLSVEQLDGKILAFDTSDETECSARTIKITGTTGVVKEQCTDGFHEDSVTLSNASKLDNAVYIRGTDDGEAFSTKIHLVKGDISDGTYVFIDEPQNAAPDGLFFKRMYTTDTEVVDGSNALKWTAEMSNNKTYFLPVCEADAIVESNFVKSDGTGTFQVAVGTSTDSGSFTHSIDSDGNFVIQDEEDDAPETLVLQEKNTAYLELLRQDNETTRYYFQQADAEAYCQESNPTDTAFKFTTDYLNGKTLYNIFEECSDRDQNGVCTGSITWEKVTMSFTDAIIASSGIFNGQPVSASDSYTITSEGYITFFSTDENETKYIKPIEKTADFIRLDWTGKRQGLSDDHIDYFFFDVVKGDAFLADKNAAINASKTSISYMKTHATERLASTDCNDRSWSSWRDAKNTLISDLAPADNMMKSIEACISVQNLVENGNQTFSNAVSSVVLGRSASGSPFSDAFDPNGTL